MAEANTSALVREALEQAEKERVRASLLPEDWQLRGVVEDTASLLDRLASALEAAQAAVEAEREACAVAAESEARCDARGYFTNNLSSRDKRIIAAIRARAQQAGEENG